MSGRAFSIGDAVFWFFKCFSRKPGGALWIAFWQMLVGGLIAVLLVSLLLPIYADLFTTALAIEAGTMSDEEGGLLILGYIAQILLTGSWAFIVGILATLSFQGAWQRFLTRGEIAPIIPLRLGGDELRLFGVNLLYIAVGFAMYIGVVTVLVTLGLTGGGIIAASGDNTAAGAVGFGLAMFLGFIGLALSVLFIAIKLSCAPSLSVHDKKFRFFESWEATNGVFGHMVLSYLLVIILIMVVGSILGFMVQLIFLGAMAPMVGDIINLVEQVEEPAVEEVLAIFQAHIMQSGVIGVFAVGVVLSYLLQIIYEGMFAGVAAYNTVRHRDGSTIDEGDAPVLGADSPLGATPKEG